jgi:PIF1-like helicase
MYVRHIMKHAIDWDYFKTINIRITRLPNQLFHQMLIKSERCSPSFSPHVPHRHHSICGQSIRTKCDDILHRVRAQSHNPHLEMCDEIHNEGLILLEDLCMTMANKLLIQLNMIPPIRSVRDAFQLELNRERQYDLQLMDDFIRNNVPLLNAQQTEVYNTLMDAVDNDTGSIFFIDAPGGTGKTFVISLILATIRARQEIALALASSGIAATLLDGGRTAYSALKLPLNINSPETPTCNITRNSGMRRLLTQCKLIVWDECTMANKKSIEAMDNTLRDIQKNPNIIFGGSMILLAGDFRQTLPVIPRGTPADELHACLTSSLLWRYVKTLRLTTNMRVQLQNDSTAERSSKQLLEIGVGKLTTYSRIGGTSG